jgi:lipopolysaccharide/colanic/teichoic acid biosynthesis glycosyltransferase
MFNDGFRRNTSFIVLRRLFSIAISLVGWIVVAPLIPLIMLAIRLDSEGPASYAQTRTARVGASL